MAIVGIDLGTTNSLVACWKEGRSFIIPNIFGETMTPSVVGFNDVGELLVGRSARERLQTHPELTTANFKRYMGTSREISLGKTKYRAEDLSAFVLKALKADAEEFLKEQVTEAVISVPAYFNDTQRQATRAAATLAGLNVRRLINEPTAAAIAYGLHKINEETIFLVFDLGGGTFDVSVLELFGGIMQVRTSAGDNHLGGEDFVNLLAGLFIKKNNLDSAKLTSYDLARLHDAAERCKRQLTIVGNALVEVKIENKLFCTEITRAEFEKISEPLLARLRTPIERALNDSRLLALDIETIVMVGGASRMPMVRSMTAKLFGKIPASHVNPDEVVASGAGVLVGMIDRAETLEEIVLTDVTPYSLGVGVENSQNKNNLDQLFVPIIERNSPIPHSRSKEFVAAALGQSKVHLDIYQGESRYVRENIKLGEIILDVPINTKDHEKVEIRFTYDVNGLLEVEGLVKSTGLKRSVVIEGNQGLLSKKDIESRLAELASIKIHPRNLSENQFVLARAARLYEESLGETRAYIGQLIERFESVLYRQDLKQTELARLELTSILKKFDKSPF